MMKKICITLCLFLGITISSNAQQVTADKAQATEISQKLKLDEPTSTLVYNVVKHISNRIEDLTLGTPNYKRLINYIAEEREEMMKSALSKEQFKLYQKMYGKEVNNEIQELINKNELFLKNEKTNVGREGSIANTAIQTNINKTLADDKKATTATYTES